MATAQSTTGTQSPKNQNPQPCLRWSNVGVTWWPRYSNVRRSGRFTAPSAGAAWVEECCVVTFAGAANAVAEAVAVPTPKVARPIPPATAARAIAFLICVRCPFVEVGHARAADCPRR